MVAMQWSHLGDPDGPARLEPPLDDKDGCNDRNDGDDEVLLWKDGLVTDGSNLALVGSSGRLAGLSP
jgi:hypothetical protein